MRRSLPLPEMATAWNDPPGATQRPWRGTRHRGDPASLSAIVTVALSSLLTLGVVVSPARAADRITAAITNPTAFDWDSFVAEDRGFFSRENLDVGITYMAPDLPVKALVAGTVDIAKSGTHFGILAAARGADLRIVAGSIYGYPYDLISQPRFQSLAELKGQKIAGASPASVTTVIFRDLLVRQGIRPADYSMLWVGGSPERFQAMHSGQVAASVAESPPFNFRSLDAGHKVLLRYGDHVKDLQYTSYFTSATFGRQARPRLVRFLRSMRQAAHWLNDPSNEKEAVHLLARRLKIDEALATRSYVYLITEQRAFRGEGRNDARGLAEMVRLLTESQMIPTTVPWESFVDQSFTTP
jgi:ABC-type nitrate/sulfonate/bicarbonate transport system substrate-binding protein